MRAMLDSHGEVRCGEESRIIPRMLAMRENWLRNKKEEERLVQARYNQHYQWLSIIGPFVHGSQLSLMQ